METQEISQESVVETLVDAGENQVESSSSQESGVNNEVAAQVTDEKDFGPALKAELARREAQLEKKYGDRAKEADAYQQNLERIAKHYGYESHNEYMAALDTYEQEQQIQAEADRRGVDVSVVRQFQDEINPLKEEVQQYKQEKEALRQERLQVQINADIADLKTKYADFDKHQEKVFDLAINHGYKLEDAYKVATYEEKISGIAKQTEAETIRKIQMNGASGTGALGSEGTEHQTGFAALSKEAQRKMIEEVKQGKRTSFD